MLIETSDIERISATQAIFSDDGERIAALFYDRLFELAPDVRPMFPDDLSEQGRKLSATLAIAVSSLSSWDELAPILAALARRHIVYGVKAWHYAVVTQALLDTLTREGVDTATVAAWNRALSVINAHMISAAYGDRAGEPTEAQAALT
ncbi:MAG: globin domain-containing protein [Tateyamaria sp.]